MTKNNTKQNIIPRPPVVVVMGHIDHGKSTLLDYIRHANVVDTEAGGITQAISAYEVTHKDEHGEDKRITFIDTPGHAAFSKMRARGAKIADIAILVVSAEDGVKPQTIEAYKTILESNTPFIVAINKIDKPGINIEKTKTELAENEIYLENYGGKVPFVLISAKEGTGVDDLLSLILILAELENFTGNINETASGIVLETNLDPKRGIEATLIVKNGTIAKGMTVATEDSVCSTRMMESFLGKALGEASFSSPIKLTGWTEVPQVGAEFKSFDKKSDAEKYVKEGGSTNSANNKQNPKENEDKKVIPIVLKADVAGMLEAIEKEISKITSESAVFKIITKDVGPVSENDIKSIATGDNIIVIGFNVKIDRNAAELALQRGINVEFFDIIYKMTEWLEQEMENRRPKIETIEVNGKAKILRAFSRTKERQILGGKVLEGIISLDKTVKIIRREFEIGKGKIVNLEKAKAKTSNVEEGAEFGMMLESKIEVVAGDLIESFKIVKK